jgi:ESS family glutamate:Na+ symporter
MEYQLATQEVVIAAVAVWFIGTFVNNRISLLKRYSIPVAVTGGILFSIAVTVMRSAFDLTISLNLELRDLLLLVFFTTIGLSARFRVLLGGGKALVILLVAAASLLFLQNTAGILSALAFGAHPAYGLFGGSVSLAGGHGTAIAWGAIAEDAGLKAAKEVGLAFATFGLVAGGIVGGPITEFLIKRHGLKGTGPARFVSGAEEEVAPTAQPPLEHALATIMLIAICVEVGAVVNGFFAHRGITVPGFLTAMMIGIAIGNFCDTAKIKLNATAIERGGEISLQLFLCMSLMSMQLWTVAEALGPIATVLALQVLVITLFGVFVVFRLMGRDYDAAVIVGGFTGLGLGATPVGIANMTAVTNKHGPSQKAFLVIPLVGAFFIDIVNALIVKFFIGLPIISETPIP